MALTAGCGDKSTGNGDAAVGDAQAIDGALGDSATPDAETADAGASDAEAPDAAVFDAAPSDAAVVDAETPDAAVDAGPQCGDGVLDPGELCDTAIGSGPGSCPTSCTSTDPCQPIVLQNGGTCAAECVTTTITACIAGDSCCPAGCDASSDADCAAVCGDHMPDLVWSEDPDEYYDAWNQACEPYWKVFMNTGASFAATETIWPVPDVSTWGSNFYWVHKQNESAYWNWTVLDMDGDGQPDLVWSEDPDQYYDAWMNAAQPFWKVFLAQ